MVHYLAETVAVAASVVKKQNRLPISYWRRAAGKSGVSPVMNQDRYITDFEILVGHASNRIGIDLGKEVESRKFSNRSHFRLRLPPDRIQ